MDLAEVAELESILLRSWPAAERHDTDGWAMLANDGVTSRANAVCAVEPGCVNIADIVAEGERWQRARGLVPMWRLTPLAGDDAAVALEARGYQPWPEPTDVMVASIGGVRPQTNAVVEAEPSVAWVAASERPLHADVVETMMTRVTGAVGYALARKGGDVVAVGRGVVAGGWLSVFGMHTRADHRGRGHAADVLVALHHWGSELGAQQATLQVTEANAAAQSLYARHGYERAYRYHYLRASA